MTYTNITNNTTSNLQAMPYLACYAKCSIRQLYVSSLYKTLLLLDRSRTSCPFNSSGHPANPGGSCTLARKCGATVSWDVKMRFVSCKRQRFCMESPLGTKPDDGIILASNQNNESALNTFETGWLAVLTWLYNESHVHEKQLFCARLPSTCML